MKRISALREARGWSRAELSRKSTVNASTISLIELGRMVPYPSQLAKLASALEFGGDPEDLLKEVHCEPIAA